MSNKKFEEGMIAGAKGFEDKFEKTAEAFKVVGEKVDGVGVAVDEIKGNVNTVIDVVEEQEGKLNPLYKKEEYDLNTILDIATLKDNEKEFFLAVLHTIATDSTNEYQQSYFRSVKNYLDIKDIPNEVDLDKISNIDSTTIRKALLQLVIEFLYLENNNFSFMDDYEFDSIKNCFELTESVVNNIKSKVEKIINVMGIDGLSEKYGYVHEVIKEATEDDENNKPLESIEFAEINVDNILSVPAGEEKVFENNIIHVNSTIVCEGTLKFQKCIIYYNEDENDVSKITLNDDGASLSFDNCRIVCKNYIKNVFFINASFYTDISISKTTLEDCTCFFNAYRSLDGNIKITECNIINPLSSFISSIAKKFELTDSFIEYTRPVGILDGSVLLFGFGETCIENVQIDAHNFLYDVEDSFMSFISNSAEVKNCTIKNTTGFINAFFNDSILITACRFENCERIFSVSDNVTMKYCVFSNCKNNLITGKGYILEYCEFINIKVDDNNAILSERGKSDKYSKIKGCIFDGCTIEKGFLLSARIWEKIDNAVLYVEDCIFKNCKTDKESGRIIKEYDTYVNVFNKKSELEVVRILGCTGLDKVNKENGYNKDNIITSDVNKDVVIGSKLKGVTVGGVLGGALGGAFGVVSVVVASMLLKDDE